MMKITSILAQGNAENKERVKSIVQILVSLKSTAKPELIFMACVSLFIVERERERLFEKF